MNHDQINSDKQNLTQMKNPVKITYQQNDG